MFTVKDIEKKVSTPKRKIKIENVYIDESGFLSDEDGCISAAISEALPDGVNTFTIQINLDLNDDEDEENDEE